MLQIYLLVAILILFIIAILDIWKPHIIHEGFTNLVSVGDSAFWAKWMPRRGDISYDPTEEEAGFIRDIRYYAGYTDIQRVGANQDFCRMVQREDDPSDQFFACALGGTQGLSSIKYRSPSTKDGFELSRDDYMNDVLGEGRDGYCRILKTGIDTFEPKCNPASDEGFKAQLVTDTNPPNHIKTLIEFYEGIVLWLRLRDDMLDYAKNIKIARAGGIHVSEHPINPPVTEGLPFNGIDQFLRIGDASDLSFGNVIDLRYLRAVSFWVRFDEFTNNAHIFDFGNGAGKDNVFCGIIGRGNTDINDNTIRKEACLDQSINTVPTPPSGEQCTEEISPQMLMETSPANVDEWSCPKPELFGRIMKPIQPKSAKPHEAKTADLLYEVWDNKQRKVHIQVKNMFPLKKWTHVVITADNNDAFKPALKIYRNGELVYTDKSGFLPQNNFTTNNYIGKSNWSNITSKYDNKDELLKGALFDFRGYQLAMSEKKIKDTYTWGKSMLGL